MRKAHNGLFSIHKHWIKRLEKRNTHNHKSQARRSTDSGNCLREMNMTTQWAWKAGPRWQEVRKDHCNCQWYKDRARRWCQENGRGSFHCCGKIKALKLHTYIRQEVKTNCRTDTGTFKELLLGLCIWLQNAWSKKAWQMFKTFYSALQKKKKILLCDWEHFLWLLICLRKASDATGESYGWNEGHKFVFLIIFVLDWA